MYLKALRVNSQNEYQRGLVQKRGNRKSWDGAQLVRYGNISAQKQKLKVADETEGNHGLSIA